MYMVLILSNLTLVVRRHSLSRITTARPCRFLPFFLPQFLNLTLPPHSDFNVHDFNEPLTLASLYCSPNFLYRLRCVAAL
ncbi:hypothetical protein GGX14DRAFT_576798 [Mycena pura]|uniref:Uncharacterized protein n=1 Tax=Mycena pura TaxID=153505 RepID=A0AAD6UT92_9AGAR|nr:hypothetical protein GGX14DRAFT_576798 [Mycena pura]